MKRPNLIHSAERASFRTLAQRFAETARTHAQARTIRRTNTRIARQRAIHVPGLDNVAYALRVGCFRTKAQKASLLEVLLLGVAVSACCRGSRLVSVVICDHDLAGIAAGISSARSPHSRRTRLSCRSCELQPSYDPDAARPPQSVAPGWTRRLRLRLRRLPTWPP